MLSELSGMAFGSTPFWLFRKSSCFCPAPYRQKHLFLPFYVKVFDKINLLYYYKNIIKRNTYSVIMNWRANDMELTRRGISERDAWKSAGIQLPDYDVKAVAERTQEAPVWVHFGIGNIFRIFIGGIAHDLISNGLLDKGITCVETFDYDVVDKIYGPFDNLVLGVTLHGDGSTDKRVLGSLTEAIKAKADDPAAMARLKQIFTDPGLQMVSFTITEKGYAIRGADGEYFGFVREDIENGPTHTTSAMSLVAAMLYERYQAGGAPLALVSMDNVSHNGEKLRSSVLEVAGEWEKRGFVDDGFLSYVQDESKVAFPWSMIDKITPRPSERIAEVLEKDGVKNMMPVITSRKTYIAPFVNAEAPQYLVVEDSFPNGRPPLEKAGVYMTDRDTVNSSERMKVTICLNPLHTALAVYGCVLGYTLLADEMKDEDLCRLVHKLGPVEGMHVVKDPGILSPQKFIDEVIHVRFPNPYIPDTPQRIAVDSSQMVGIRFGETIKAYVERYGDAKKLTAVPLAIAGWCRYLLAVTDEGKPFELSPDPMNGELTDMLSGVEFGNPDSFTNQLKPILSNVHIFGIDLYEAGIGETIEKMFREEIAGCGAVRKTLQKYLR